MKLINYDNMIEVVKETKDKEGNVSFIVEYPEMMLILHSGMRALLSIKAFASFAGLAYFLPSDSLSFFNFLPSEFEDMLKTVQDKSDQFYSTIDNISLSLRKENEKIILGVYNLGDVPFNFFCDSFIFWGLLWQFVHRLSTPSTDLGVLVVGAERVVLDGVNKENISVPFLLDTMPFFAKSDILTFNTAMNLFMEDNDFSIDNIKDLAVDYIGTHWSNEENRAYWSDLLLVSLCHIVKNENQLKELHSYISNKAWRYMVQLLLERQGLWTE